MIAEIAKRMVSFAPVLNAAWVIGVALTLQQAPPPTTPPPLPNEQPIRQIAQNLAKDLKALPSKETALTLGAGALGASLAHHADAPLAGRRRLWQRGGHCGRRSRDARSQRRLVERGADRHGGRRRDLSGPPLTVTARSRRTLRATAASGRRPHPSPRARTTG